MSKALALIAVVLAVAGCAGTGSRQASIKEEPATYSDGGTTLSGYVVYDESRKDRRPGMLVVHEW